MGLGKLYLLILIRGIDTNLFRQYEKIRYFPIFGARLSQITLTVVPIKVTYQVRGPTLAADGYFKNGILAINLSPALSPGEKEPLFGL